MPKIRKRRNRMSYGFRFKELKFENEEKKIGKVRVVYLDYIEKKIDMNTFKRINIKRIEVVPES
jgi:hypothetical protein